VILRGISALLLGVLCALVVGCGSSGSSAELLRGTEASGLKQKLDAVRQAVADRNVGACAARLRELQSSVSNLPPARSKLRTRLQQEISDKLVPATENECNAPLTQTLQTTTVPPPTQSTQSTDTTAPPPASTATTDAVPPPDTTTTPTTPTAPTTPPPDPGGATVPGPGTGGVGPGTGTGTGGAG
jgi:hypothetical protein